METKKNVNNQKTYISHQIVKPTISQIIHWVEKYIPKILYIEIHKFNKSFFYHRKFSKTHIFLIKKKNKNLLLFLD